MKRDDFVRALWLAGFVFVFETPDGHKFRRGDDGLEVIVPKQEVVDQHWADLRLRGVPETARNQSPCCRAESRLRRIVGDLILFRCLDCQKIWQRELGAPPTLRVVRND